MNEPLFAIRFTEKWIPERYNDIFPIGEIFQIAEVVDIYDKQGTLTLGFLFDEVPKEYDEQAKIWRATLFDCRAFLPVSYKEYLEINDGIQILQGTYDQ